MSLDGAVPRPRILTLSSATGTRTWTELDITCVTVDTPADFGLDEDLAPWQAAEAHRIDIRSGHAVITVCTPLGEMRARRRLATLAACAAPESVPPDFVLVDAPAFRYRGGEYGCCPTFPRC